MGGSGWWWFFEKFCLWRGHCLIMWIRECWKKEHDDKKEYGGNKEYITGDTKFMRPVKQSGSLTRRLRPVSSCIPFNFIL